MTPAQKLDGRVDPQIAKVSLPQVSGNATHIGLAAFKPSNVTFGLVLETFKLDTASEE